MSLIKFLIWFVLPMILFISYWMLEEYIRYKTSYPILSYLFIIISISYIIYEVIP